MFLFLKILYKKIMRILKEIYRKLLPISKYPKYLRDKGVKIGEGCEIYKNANFGSEPYLISIGNYVRINEGVQLITHDGGMWVLRHMNNYAKEFQDADKFGKIIIKDNVHIGTNAIIMPGVTIGENSIVACGAIVTHNIPANSVVAGIPAKQIETIEEYAQKQKDKYKNTKHMSQEEKRNFLQNLFS
ncbi:MAG: acyltransferase [Clostridium cadaveris]